jgi:hypothetical protein
MLENDLSYADEVQKQNHNRREVLRSLWRNCAERNKRRAVELAENGFGVIRIVAETSISTQDAFVLVTGERVKNER